MYRNTQAWGFIKGEMFWYLMTDGESKDMGNQNFFFWGGSGGIWKKMGSYFLQIQSYSKPYTDDVLSYLNMKDPSKHSCTWWYQECKNLNSTGE